MTDSHTRDFPDVLAMERDLIAVHRERRGERGERLVGLALSGGGIRSASFGMGVLQALHAGGVFAKLDYLSTVSGGGYIGSALTWFLRKGPTDFPFGRETVGARSDEAEDPEAIRDFIRQHGNYLAPRTGFNARSFDPDDPRPNPKAWGRGGVSLVSLAAVVLKQMVFSTFVYGALLVVAFFALNVLDAAVLPVWAILQVYAQPPELDALLGQANVALLVAGVLAVLFVLGSLVSPVATSVARLWPAGGRGRERALRWSYRTRLRFDRGLGRLLSGIGVALVVGSVPVVSRLLEQWLERAWARGAVASVSATLGALLGSVVFRRRRAKGKGPPPALVDTVGVSAGAFLMIYGLLMLTYTAAVSIADSGSVSSIWIVLAAGLGLALLGDLNALGSHRIYRDRLMEAFLPGRFAVAENEWRPAVEAAGAPLHAMCSDATPGPYHLLNATLITVDSPKSKYRGRGGDSFVMSPLFCGSDATGWRRTSSWLDGRMTLATAMAISAAAANPNAAVSGRGATRSRMVSTFMALLNLRLGYWAANPDREYPVRWPRLPANFLYPGLMQGLLGSRVSETSPYVELCDGGDFENLGLYELVRRNVDVVIVADASEDPKCSLDSLADALERIRVDFGVSVTFPDAERDLTGLLPGSAGDDPAAARYCFVRRAYAIGKIAYPDSRGELAKEGLLVYVKAAMTRGLPGDLLGFKAEHGNFPDEPTADQFFDESHFEAYRELGYRLTRAMLEEERVLRELGTGELLASRGVQDRASASP